MIKKYLIAGGPGSGKTSLVLGLELMGEKIVRECAEDYIRVEQARGINQPWRNPDFQKKLLEIQIRREKEIEASSYTRAFLDSGLIDFLVYSRQSTNPQEEFMENLRASLQSLEKYSRVFFVPSPIKCKTNSIRRESYAESIDLDLKIKKAYQRQGYNTTQLPDIDFDSKIKLILDQVNNER